MTIDIDQMKADMEAGTPGPWEYDPDGPHSHDVYGGTKGFHICRATAGIPETQVAANARRIARVPEMEAEILRLREALECIYRGDDSPDGMVGDIARAALNEDPKP